MRQAALCVQKHEGQFVFAGCLVVPLDDIDSWMMASNLSNASQAGSNSRTLRVERLVFVTL